MKDMPIVSLDEPVADWIDLTLNAVRWFFFAIGILAAIGIAGYFYQKDRYPEATRGKSPAELRAAIECGSGK